MVAGAGSQAPSTYRVGTASPPFGEGRAEGRGMFRLDHVGEIDRGDRERNGGSLATPAGRLYANAAISVAADWRLMVAGAASGAS